MQCAARRDGANLAALLPTGRQGRRGAPGVASDKGRRARAPCARGAWAGDGARDPSRGKGGLEAGLFDAALRANGCNAQIADFAKYC